jgi:hypothetical protein
VVTGAAPEKGRGAGISARKICSASSGLDARLSTAQAAARERSCALDFLKIVNHPLTG